MSAKKSSTLLVTIANSLGDDDLHRLIRRYLFAPVERTELSPLLGKILAAVMAQQGHRRPVDAMLRAAADDPTSTLLAP